MIARVDARHGGTPRRRPGYHDGKQPERHGRRGSQLPEAARRTITELPASWRSADPIEPIGSAATFVLAVGFCGAFTTFSSFAVETVTTATAGETRIAVVFALTTLVGAVVALLVGSAIAAALW